MLAAIVLNSLLSLPPLSDGAHERLPKIGDQFRVQDSTRWCMVSASQLSKCTHAQIDQVKVEIAVDDSDVIRYVSTRDTAFQTPEGIKPGATLAEVLATGAKTPVNERGWAYHTKLASGWSVAFITEPNMTDVEPSANSRVAWIFKR